MPAAISILHIVAAILCFAELAIVGYRKIHPSYAPCSTINIIEITTHAFLRRAEDIRKCIDGIPLLTSRLLTVLSPFSGSLSAITPSNLAFMMFNSIWSLLVLAYVALAPRLFANLFHDLVALAIEWITMLFWFAGAIAFATSYGAWTEICGYLGRCHSYRAGEVFGFFIWLLFLAIAVLETIEFRRSRGHRTSAPVVKAYTAA